MVGRLEIILGSMRSCKSTELKRRITRAESLGNRVFVINNISDTRYGNDRIATHSGDHHFAHMFEKLDEIFKVDLNDYDMIAIDEGSLFSDLNEVVRKLISPPYNKYVVLASLNSDSEMETFGSVHLLICKADEIVHLTALCQSCGKDCPTPAPFTKWVGLEEKTSQINTGCEGKYTSVCRRHHPMSISVAQNVPSPLEPQIV